VTDVRPRGTTERGHRPDVPVPAPRQPADPPLQVADGVELSRLLALAWLTPAQALELGSGLLAAAAARSDPEAGSAGSDRLPIDRLVLGADGRVTLRLAPDRRDDGRPPGGPSGVDVGAVLADVARAARLRARCAGPAADQLLAELDRAVAELPVAGVPAVARTLGAAAAGTDPTAVRAELGALARAVGGYAGQVRGAGPAGAASTAIRPAPAPAPRASTGANRNVGRRIGAWLLSIVVLAGVGVLEVAVLRDKVATDIDVLLDAGRSGSAPSAAPEPDGLPIVPPAPAAAGSVRGVDLRPLAQCTPGAPCTVRVLVRVVPGADPQVVTWSYRIVDRCTGAVVPAPGGSVSVPAGGERVAVVGTVPLPTAQAVEVVAVTELPAAAASPPVLLGSCGSGTG
jgi:hypothetical protein